MSRKLIPTVALLAFCASAYAAHALGLGYEGRSFGRLGSSIKNGSGGGGGGATGRILSADGTSFILQTDGASKICRAGGC